MMIVTRTMIATEIADFDRSCFVGSNFILRLSYAPASSLRYSRLPKLANAPTLPSAPGSGDRLSAPEGGLAVHLRARLRSLRRDWCPRCSCFPTHEYGRSSRDRAAKACAHEPRPHHGR